MALVVKNLPANAGDIRDVGSIPGSGRSPGVGHGNPLQYSCLENPKDRVAWQATVHRVAKSQTRLRNLACFHTFLRPIDQNCISVLLINKEQYSKLCNSFKINILILKLTWGKTSLSSTLLVQWPESCISNKRWVNRRNKFIHIHMKAHRTENPTEAETYIQFLQRATYIWSREKTKWSLVASACSGLKQGSGSQPETEARSHSESTRS